jgi:hypothetical protein
LSGPDSLARIGVSVVRDPEVCSPDIAHGHSRPAVLDAVPDIKAETDETVEIVAECAAKRAAATAGSGGASHQHSLPHRKGQLREGRMGVQIGSRDIPLKKSAGWDITGDRSPPDYHFRSAGKGAFRRFETAVNMKKKRAKQFWFHDHPSPSILNSSLQIVEELLSCPWPGNSVR